YVVCGTSAMYLLLAQGHPHRGMIALAFASGALGGAIVSTLPRERIVRSRMREPFFLTWSALDLALITLATAADGGTGSPLALIFFVPVVFAAMSYPLASVI